jgi:excisionase family DNA binding protein
MMRFQPGRVVTLIRSADDEPLGGPTDGGPVDRAEAYLMPSEAAVLLGVSPRTLSRWAASGRVPCLITLGGHRRYRRSDVQRLLDEGGPTA